MGVRKEETSKNSSLKKDLQNFKEEIIHQFHLISEGLIDQIKLLAEGHTGIIEKLKTVDQRLDRLEKGNELLAQGQSGIIQRLDGVETRLDRVDTRLDRVETRLDGVETRLDRVETRFDGVETRLDHMEKESERQHLETRALVKLSFSELDKRLSNLESQVKEIQEWKKQVEARLSI
jgi:chromosome segregation ATPase